MTNNEMNFINNSEGRKDKIREAKELIHDSQDLVAEVDASFQEFQLGLSKAATDFDVWKRAFLNKLFRSSEELLKKVGVEYLSNRSIHETFELSVESLVDKLEIENIHSGRFTGLILGTVVALVTLFGWFYFATKALSIPLENITLESIESHRDALLNWIGGGVVGLEGDIMVGAGILAVSGLLMGWMVYALRVHFKTKKNLMVAKEAYLESRAYASSKDTCKKEILRVDAHLRELIISIENFNIILGEQNAILKRILYVEGGVYEDKEYHPNSKRTMRETEKIMKCIEKLLHTSVTKEGRLNLESQTALSISKAVYAEFISRLYA